MNAFSLTLLATWLTAAPSVQIESPASGWTTQRIITLEGSVQEAGDLGVLVVNGVERPLPLAGGRFDATFALGRGENAIEVIAPARDGVSAPARASLALYAEIPQVGLQVVLSWDTDGTDVDLHIREPDGTHVYYGNRESPHGGRLDRDDVDGYGPEIYSSATAPSGTYQISAHFFGERNSSDSDASGVQTSASVIVVAREGTADELRWRFEVPLTRPGEEVVVGRLTLPPPGERLAELPTPRAREMVRDSLPHSGRR